MIGEAVVYPLKFTVFFLGSNVLFLRKNLSLGVHLLYALLCGRPVVVLAEPSNERSVARLVSHLYPKTRKIS